MTLADESTPYSMRYVTGSGPTWPPSKGASTISASHSKEVSAKPMPQAVILQQGKFDKFLRGDKAGRREVLAGLLNLDVYL